MSLKSSLPQLPNSVSLVLTPNTRDTCDSRVAGRSRLDCRQEDDPVVVARPRPLKVVLPSGVVRLS